MKKNLLAISLIVVTVFIGCKKDEETNSSASNNTSNTCTVESSLIGTWKYTSPTYSFDFIFHNATSGVKQDTDKDTTNFTYTSDANHITFTSGFNTIAPYKSGCGYILFYENALDTKADTLFKQ